jgi:hypothetical protein
MLLVESTVTPPRDLTATNGRILCHDRTNYKWWHFSLSSDFLFTRLIYWGEKTSFCNSYVTKWDILPYGTVKELDFGGLFDGIVPSILAKHFVVKEKYPGGPSPAGTTEICRSSHNLCT